MKIGNYLKEEIITVTTGKDKYKPAPIK